MAEVNSGSLTKMQLQAYKDPDFSSTNGSALTVTINPSKYTHNYSINYNNTDEIGANGASPKFKRIGREQVSFELIYDATGAYSDKATDIVTPINNLKKTVYKYDGTEHEPNYVQLLWGTLVFNCRLTKMTVNYTLFKPSGTPLRARVELEFIGFTDEETLAKMANNSSPDLTHILTVKPGDTLPLMCHQVYNNSAYYLMVAEQNKLNDFRDIRPGDTLYFPPVTT